MTLADLERRLATAERAHAPAAGQPTLNRRNALARFAQEKAAALADPECSTVKRLRYEADMSASALAIMAGVSRDTLSRAERGGNVSPASLRRIARALGVSVAALK